MDDEAVYLELMAADFAARCEAESEANRMVTTRQAAERLQCSEWLIRDRWRKGELTARGTASKLVFRWGDVLDCFTVRPPGRHEATEPRKPRQRTRQMPGRLSAIGRAARREEAVA